MKPMSNVKVWKEFFRLKVEEILSIVVLLVLLVALCFVLNGSAFITYVIGRAVFGAFSPSYEESLGAALSWSLVPVVLISMYYFICDNWRKAKQNVKYNEWVKKHA